MRLFPVLVLAAAWLHAGSAAAGTLADCPRTFDTEEVSQAAALAVGAFVSVDLPAFTGARLEMEARFACTRDLLAPERIAEIHEVEALGAFLDGRPEAVPEALAGLFAAEPGHQISATTLPDGHPVRKQVPAAMRALRNDPGTPMPEPASGWIEVDSVAAKLAPTQRAALLQQVDGQGQVVATHYRWPDEAGYTWLGTIPARGSAPAPHPVPTHLAKEMGTPGPWAHRAPLLVVTGASLITSGVLFALAAEGRSEFEADPVLSANADLDARTAYRTDLEELQGRVNTSAISAYVAAGAGLAVGVVTVVVW